MKIRVSPETMLRTGLNLCGKPLTARQRAALVRREATLKIQNAQNCVREGVPVGSQVYKKACIGCYSGIRPWNQGSDYCDRCIKNDRP